VKSSINGKMNPDWYKQYYEKNKEKILRKNREYWKINGKRVRRDIGYENRLMVISLLRERDGDNCGICNKYLIYGEEQIDHIIGVKAGGLHTADNIQLAHRDCNLHKERKNG